MHSSSRTAALARRITCLTAFALLASLVMVQAASAAITKRTVPGTYVFAYGANPTDPGNCSAIVFIQWADVANTTSATVKYVAMKNGTRGPQSETMQPPYDDTYTWVRTYTVPAGSHWIQVGAGWGDGPKPNDCSEMSERQKGGYDPNPTVELTITTPDPATITQLGRPVGLDSKREAIVANVKCPTGSTCIVKGAKTVKVKVGTKTYKLAVKFVGKLEGGRTVPVRVVVPMAVRNALMGAKIVPHVKLSASSTGAPTITRTIKRAIKIR